MTLTDSYSIRPSWKYLYCINTMFPTSKPPTKYYTEGPKFPPPAQIS